MLQVAYYDQTRELLVDGFREDYEQLHNAVCEVLASHSEIALPFQSTGETPVSHFVVKNGPPPNRVSYEHGRIVISVAPSLQVQFLAVIQFPDNADLPKSPVGYHYHYEPHGGDEAYIAPDSLPVVFGLEGTQA